jgi:hypothetical protein
MEKIMTDFVKAFIHANATAYATAAKVFKEIESASDTWAETLASAGIVGADIQPFAVAYVAQQTGTKPYPSRKGGALIFKKDSPEHSSVKYLVDVATGKAQVKAAKRKESHGKKENDVLTKLLTMYAALTPAQKRAFKASI